jgi:putative transposase
LPDTPLTNSTLSQRHSTAGPARHSVGARRQKRSTSIYDPVKRNPLRRPVESAQFGSWVFSQKVTEAGLAPSVGAVGAPFDNAMVEAFWARMQVELLNRRRWRTRVELAAAIQSYIEIWHNTRRRHSALNMLAPSEHENQHQRQQIAA